MVGLGGIIGFVKGFFKGFADGFKQSFNDAKKKEAEVKKLINEPFDKSKMSIEAIAGAYGIGEAMKEAKKRGIDLTGKGS